MSDKCALAGHERIFGYSDCHSDIEPCKGCNRLICEYHKIWVECGLLCNECIANDIPVIIDGICWTAYAGLIASYVEYYKRFYCVHTKRAGKD